MNRNLPTEAPALLRHLEQTVARFPAKPPVRGVFAFGVTTEAQAWWWRVVCADTVACSWSHEQPQGWDAALLLDARTADDVAFRGRPGRATASTGGSKQRLQQFLAAYLGAKSLLQLRSR